MKNDKLINRIKKTCTSDKLYIYPDGEFSENKIRHPNDTHLKLQINDIWDDLAIGETLADFFTKTNPCQYTATSDIDPEGFRGTRDGWENLLMQYDDWYRYYVDDCISLGDDILSMNDWVDWLLDENLRQWDGNIDLPSLDDN